MMLKSNRDTTQRYKVIIEKPTYAGDEMHSKYLHVSIDTDVAQVFNRVTH